MHICRWDSAQRKYVHTFYPLLYMFVLTECFEAYLAFFETARQIPRTFFNKSLLEVKCGGLDRSSQIAKAYLQVWPEIRLLQCWPHLARKFKEGDFLKRLVDKENLSTIEKHVRLLHACRSDPQFRMLAQFVFRVWKENMGEGAFADKFVQFYFHDHWGNWHVTASGICGVMPSAQGIENGHKIQKLVIGPYVPALRFCIKESLTSHAAHILWVSFCVCTSRLTPSVST